MIFAEPSPDAGASELLIEATSHGIQVRFPLRETDFFSYDLLRAKQRRA